MTTRLMRNARLVDLISTLFLDTGLGKAARKPMIAMAFCRRRRLPRWEQQKLCVTPPGWSATTQNLT
jgi:hypothetical protein